jgi:hypothetical protein
MPVSVEAGSEKDAEGRSAREPDHEERVCCRRDGRTLLVPMRQRTSMGTKASRWPNLAKTTVEVVEKKNRRAAD